MRVCVRACVVQTYLAPAFWTAGITAMAFPLFQMTAMGATNAGEDATRDEQKRGGTKQVRGGEGLKERDT